MAQELCEKKMFNAGVKAFGVALIIQGLSGILDPDNYAQRKAYYSAFNSTVSPNQEQLDEGTYLFEYFYYILSCLYICAGGSIITGMNVGPRISFGLIVTYTFIFANPYLQKSNFDQASVWILLIKQLGMLGSCMLIETHGKISETRQDVHFFSRGSSGANSSKNLNHSSGSISPGHNSPRRSPTYQNAVMKE